MSVSELIPDGAEWRHEKRWTLIKALKPDIPAVRVFADGRLLKAQVHAVLLLVVGYHSVKRYRSLCGLEICGKQRAWKMPRTASTTKTVLPKTRCCSEQAPTSSFPGRGGTRG